MRENKGYKIEERLRKFFRGIHSPLEEIDFETSTSLYEVKSCKIFNKCNNANQLRKWKVKPNKKINSRQLGRFRILTGKHIALYLRSLQTRKIPKYIFAIRYGNQIIFKVVPWEDLKIKSDKEFHHIPIGNIFYEKEEEDGGDSHTPSW